jgi:hypothetical protein
MGADIYLKSKFDKNFDNVKKKSMKQKHFIKLLHNIVLLMLQMVKKVRMTQ